LELAGQLGLTTVAEGWLIAKPFTATGFLPWLETHRARAYSG